jgi:hypothetical protein
VQAGGKRSAGTRTWHSLGWGIRGYKPCWSSHLDVHGLAVEGVVAHTASSACLRLVLAVRWAWSSRQRPESLAVSLDTLGVCGDKVSPLWLTVCSLVFLQPLAWAAWLRCPGLARFLPSPGDECGCELLRGGGPRWSGSAWFIESRERVGWQAIRLQRRSP